MVTWSRDKTGRFPRRPYFERGEIDSICEGTVARFLAERHGAVRFPLGTDDLTVLIEEMVDSLDAYAEFPLAEADVEGVTDFHPGSKPSVRISRRISENPRLINRFRTTLSHELGHVLLHTSLWPAGQETLLPQHTVSRKCLRTDMFPSGGVDWMEWQAGYASGALLMPASPLTELARSLASGSGTTGRTALGSALGGAILEAAMRLFEVSSDAARVRLLQLDLLVTEDAGSALFR